MSLRKLRVLLEHLPPDSPVYWHATDGKPWTIHEQLLWQTLWATSVGASAAANMRKGQSIFDRMPQYPWSKPEGRAQQFGSLEGVDQNDVLDYLDSL